MMEIHAMGMVVLRIVHRLKMAMIVKHQAKTAFPQGVAMGRLKMMKNVMKEN